MQNEGPPAYENWLHWSRGEPWIGAHEYPLHTDARVLGGIRVVYGPYELTNTVHTMPHRPALILYVRYHRKPYTVPDKIATNDGYYHGGQLQDELAALLSLCLGIRLKAGGETREFAPNGDPRGLPTAHSFGDDPVLSNKWHLPVIPLALGDHHLDLAAPLGSLGELTADQAIALVRSARLYQEALWIADSAPELSWLMLTSSVETAANVWRAHQDAPVERLKASKPELAHLLGESCSDGVLERVAEQIADSLGATKKFQDFMIQFLPPPPRDRPPEGAQQPWDEKEMRRSLRVVYKYRSDALHSGRPFPAPMCQPPIKVGDKNVFAEVPLGLAQTIGGTTWAKRDTPMLLHTFEFLVRNSLLAWWRSMLRDGRFKDPSPVVLV